MSVIMRKKGTGVLAPFYRYRQTSKHKLVVSPVTPCSRWCLKADPNLHASRVTSNTVFKMAARHVETGGCSEHGESFPLRTAIFTTLNGSDLSWTVSGH
ncbi:hypothetical protein BaRGS_00023488 [Batillaria attramentaria]|uniref:Uncharacterized protein n=1 Tax=Batillaria attramentaria TaxID=370345 RepID=A0ABD0KE18_9CAEN